MSSMQFFQKGPLKDCFPDQASFRVRAMDRYLNLVRLPENDADAAGPKGFQVPVILCSVYDRIHDHVLSCAVFVLIFMSCRSMNGQ